MKLKKFISKVGQDITKPFKQWQLEQRRVHFYLTATRAQLMAGNKELGIPPVPAHWQGKTIVKKQRVAAHLRSDGKKVKSYTRKRAK